MTTTSRILATSSDVRRATDDAAARRSALRQDILAEGTVVGAGRVVLLDFSKNKQTAVAQLAREVTELFLLDASDVLHTPLVVRTWFTGARVDLAQLTDRVFLLRPYLYHRSSCLSITHSP